MTTPVAVGSITATDEELAAYVKKAELPPLLAALAQATGNMSLLDEQLRPPLAPANPFAGPQRGLTDAQVTEGRARAVQALIQLRDSINVNPLPLDAVPQLLSFLTGGASAESFPLLASELGLDPCQGLPSAGGAVVADRGETPAAQELADFSVVIIGAGVAGLAAAHQMRKDGVSFTLVEKSDAVGGTWWKNHYPGCRLDTDNYTYSFSFAHRRYWPNQFSLRDDVQGYLEELADELNLGDDLRLGTEVVSIRFDETSLLWDVQLKDRDGRAEHLSVNAVITGMGQLDRPQIPDISGRDRFQGKSFHTAEWDDSVDLTGRRVAVVGSGASAFQVVPAIVDTVDALIVFQRNAPWMSPTPNYYDPTPHEMAWLLDHVPNYDRWLRINRLWVMIDGRRPYTIVDPEWRNERSISELSESMCQMLGEYISSQYTIKPELAEKAVPTYPPYAKRVLRDNGAWADALQRPHTVVVSDGIRAITETGLVTADGTEHPVDVIVWATGFLASEFLEPLTVQGRGGVDLHQQWKGDAKAYLGVSVPNFPNLFMVGGPNTGLVAYGSHHLFTECAVHYISKCITALRQRGGGALDMKWEPFAQFNDELDRANRMMAWGASSVSSWYKNSLGRVSQVWPHTTLDYWRSTREAHLDKYDVMTIGGVGAC